MAYEIDVLELTQQEEKPDTKTARGVCYALIETSGDPSGT